MYELSRVRLHAVGPRGARYQDVMLDLRRDPLGRPSPATVLFLENGGGKTVLVRLIFSVILPGRRQVVGTTTSKVLEKYVLAGDVAHVAIEWRDTRSGQLLVTGKAAEWQGHVVSADSSRLNERWYTFRPGAALGLDTLPFTRDGRIVSLAGFREALEEAGKADAALQVAWEQGHGNWTSHLDNLRLDPELFSYQRKMNAGEGEAADAFTFKTDEAFVDWLLTAIIPDEEPRSLGEVVSEYAVSLASRGELVAERDYVHGALERLGPLVFAAGERTAAISLHRDALDDAERFVVALAGRIADESERQRVLSDRLIEVDRQERALDQEERRLNQVVLELSRLTAKLRWDAALEQSKRLEGERDAARALLAAWQAIDVVVAYRTAREAAQTIRVLVQQQEEEAAPLLRARDAAARRFVRGLLDVAAAAEREAAEYDARASGLDTDIEAAEGNQREAIGEAAAATARIGQATENITGVQNAIRAAVATGLLAEGADVAEAASTAAESADTADAAAAQALERITELAGDRAEADADLDSARTNREAKKRVADDLGGQLSTGQAFADGLRAESRLTALLGADEIMLDDDVPTLLSLLAQSAVEHQDEIDAARVEAVTDDRVLAALGDGGLLPPGEDLTAALRILADERILAWSGWRYLSGIRVDERDQVLARCPQLVDGIVLNSGDDLETAREKLAAAQLLPQAIIAVGTTAVLLDPDAGAPAGIGFIVPPNPAMYDEERAEQERQRIQRRVEKRGTRIAELESAAGADKALSSRLTDWQREYPPGRLTRLAEDHQRADEELRASLELEQRCQGILNELVAQQGQLTQQLPRLNKLAKEAHEKATGLRALAAEHAKVAGWQETIRTSRGEHGKAEQEADRNRDLARRLRGQQAEARQAAGDQRRTASHRRGEIGDVVGGGSVGEDEPVPGESLEELRAAYLTAAAAYEKVEVGYDLRLEVDRLSRAESGARSAVEKIDQKARGKAEELLLTPDGSDASARAEAEARCQRRAGSLEEDVTAAAKEAGKLEQAFLSYQPQDRSLEPYGKPQDIPHGEALIAGATADRDKARTDHDEILATQGRLNTDLTALGRLTGDLDTVRDSLAAVVSPPPDRMATPFVGTVDLARARRNKVRQALNEARRLLEGATELVRNAADALAQHAIDGRFEKVNAPIRRQMLTTDRGRLPDFAAEWETALRPRFRVLSDELAQIERHRSAIVERLLGMVKYALGRLRAAQHASRLPADFGDWSGLEFLRIAFSSPEEAVMTEILGQVIDDAAVANTAKDRDLGKRDGLSILLNGVRACLHSKGVRVDMLKPDAVLRDERVRVAEMADVFSGGQLLTAAIILYCTMAWLRASERGQAQRPHAGVLFLDNPIGRASAGYLLELQMTVAKKLGVQLVYTTGLFDTNALSVFPLIVRLRNDADLRAGMKYLRVDEEIRKRLPDTPADETGVLAASRLYVREDTSVP